MGVQVLCQVTPKCRKKALLGKTADIEILGACPAQENRIEKGHPMPDSVHQEMANKQVDQMQLRLASS
jgi:hypothetical protein